MFRIGAPSPGITYQRRLRRSIDELVGLCRGVVADGDVNRAEVDFLQRWLVSNRDFVHEYPFRDLYALIENALVDGVIDSEEERDILAAVHGLAGNVVTPSESPAMGVATSTSSRLPLCDPAPDVEFSGRGFVVTGLFEYGPRSRVFGAISERGGVPKKSVSRQVHYVVVGNLGSRDWLHSSYGTKIQQAVDLRAGGFPLHIIDEAHWRARLGE